jgi:hypothetical protein
LLCQIHKSTAYRQAFNNQTFLIIGADFIKHLLNPPKPPTNPYLPTFLYSKLTQIQFPLNVKILPDKQFEKLKRDQISAIRARQAKIEHQKKEAELLKSVHRERFERQIVLRKQRRRAKKLLQEEQRDILEEQEKKENDYSQFYGRPM